jgi:hypothetical protein
MDDEKQAFGSWAPELLKGQTNALLGWLAGDCQNLRCREGGLLTGQ